MSAHKTRNIHARINPQSAPFAPIVHVGDISLFHHAGVFIGGFNDLFEMRVIIAYLVFDFFDSCVFLGNMIGF